MSEYFRTRGFRGFGLETQLSAGAAVQPRTTFPVYNIDQTFSPEAEPEGHRAPTASGVVLSPLAVTLLETSHRAPAAEGSADICNTVSCPAILPEKWMGAGEPGTATEDMMQGGGGGGGGGGGDEGDGGGCWTESDLAAVCAMPKYNGQYGQGANGPVCTLPDGSAVGIVDGCNLQQLTSPYSQTPAATKGVGAIAAVGVGALALLFLLK